MGKRRWLLWVLVISFIWLVASSLDDLEELFQTLRQGIWLWVLAAAVVQVGYYVGQAALHKIAFATLGVQSRVLSLVPVFMGSMFINVVTPAGGMAGLALFVDDAVQRGQSGARTAAGSILAVTAMYVTLMLLLLVSFVYLYLYASLSILQVTTTIIFTLFTGALGGLLFLGYSRPVALRRVLLWLQRSVNGLATRFKRDPWLSANWAEKTASEFTEAASAAGQRPQTLWAALGMALASHLLHVLTLYFLFLAFRAPQVPAGALIAGYSMGMLFAVIAPTPQGVGFVENIMPNVFIAAGTPSALATLVVLAYRGLTFWLPLLIGFFLLQRLKSLGAEERSLTEVWGVRIVAVFTALMGVINALAAAPRNLVQVLDIPGVPDDLASDLAIVAEYSPLEVQQGGQLTAAVSGLALLLLASALWRRKRTAWMLTLGVLLFSAVNHAWERDFVVAGLAAALAVWLFFLQPRFHARSDRPSVRQAIQLLLVAWGFILAYGVFGYYWLTNLAGQSYSARDALQQTAIMMTRFYDPGLIEVGEASRVFGFAIYLLSGLTYAYVFLLLVRPVLQRQPVTPGQRQQAERIVAQYGQTAYSLLALWRAEHFFFSNGGSLVAYDLQGRTAVALGDPVGPAEDRQEATRSFSRFCRRNDWTPAFYQVRAENLDHYRALGFNVIGVGREGRIDLRNLDLQEPHFAALRQKVDELVMRGHHATFVAPPLPEALLDRLHQISDEWLTLMNMSRKRLWLGEFERDYVRDRPCVLTYTPEGVISAFATLIEPPQRAEVGIDLLQHRTQIEPGTIALLFVTLLAWAQAQGYECLSCGTIPLDDDSVASGNRVLNALYQNVSQYTFRDTHEVEVQFAPQWSLRYLAYPGTMSLPAVWRAVLRGNGDSGGVVWFWLKRRLGL